MNWMHYGLAVLAALVACSLSDWLFMGVLFHDKYTEHPEVWRSSVTEGGESSAIAWSTLMTFVTCAGFICICALFGFTTIPRAFALSFGIWLSVPLPLLVTNGFFIKLHPYVTLSHAAGWLAKLLICALSAHYLL
jgi:hypothetical protein